MKAMVLYKAYFGRNSALNSRMAVTPGATGLDGNVAGGPRGLDSGEMIEY
jgi:hypothetical protein